MYCYHCGNQIFNGSSKCPICSVSMEQINELLANEELALLRELLPATDLNRTKKFAIGKDEINISDERYIFCRLVKMRILLENNSWNLYVDFTKYKSFNLFVEFAEENTTKLLQTVVDLWAEDLKYNQIPFEAWEIDGIKDETDMMIEDIMEPVYYIASQFEDMNEIMNKTRGRVKKKRTTKWVGGGFGIKGAIKGSIQAGAMNIAGSAINGTANLARTGIQYLYDKNRIRVAKNKVMDCEEIWEAIHEIWREAFDILFERFLWIALHSWTEINKFVEDYNGCFEGRRIISKRDIAVERIRRQPYDLNSYMSLYTNDRANGPALFDMASFCGIEREVLEEFLAVDGDVFSKAEYGFKNIGIDTSDDELREIKKRLEELMDNNPAYKTNIMNDRVKRVVEYEKKIGNLLETADRRKRIDTIKRKTERVASVMSNNEIYEKGIEEFVQSVDIEIQNALFCYLKTEFEKKGIKEYLEKYSTCAYPIVLDAISVRVHEVHEDKGHFDRVECGANIGRLFPLAHVGRCYLWGIHKVKKDEEKGLKMVKEAISQGCYSALRTLSGFYKNGEFGYEKNEQLSSYYLDLADAYQDVIDKYIGKEVTN